jgi:hypothetical protein
MVITEEHGYNGKNYLVREKNGEITGKPMYQVTNSDDPFQIIEQWSTDKDTACNVYDRVKKAISNGYYTKLNK